MWIYSFLLREKKTANFPHIVSYLLIKACYSQKIVDDDHDSWWWWWCWWWLSQWTVWLAHQSVVAKLLLTTACVWFKKLFFRHIVLSPPKLSPSSSSSSMSNRYESTTCTLFKTGKRVAPAPPHTFFNGSLPLDNQKRILWSSLIQFSPDRIFIASNYCCRWLLLPQLSLSRVPLAWGASTWSPPNLRFPPLWELRERGGGAHLQKEEKRGTEGGGTNFPPKTPSLYLMVSLVSLSTLTHCPDKIQIYL